MILSPYRDFWSWGGTSASCNQIVLVSLAWCGTVSSSYFLFGQHILKCVMLTVFEFRLLNQIMFLKAAGTGGSCLARVAGAAAEESRAGAGLASATASCLLLPSESDSEK